MNGIRYGIVDFGSAEQIQSLGLRDAVLRKPLGLEFDPEDLKKEKNQVHIIAGNGQRIIGCLLLMHDSGKPVKMRQVAVHPQFQGTGIGAGMVQIAETWCIENGYKKMELHARETAIPFYLKLGYHTKGAVFTEVGIPHMTMEKILS